MGDPSSFYQGEQGRAYHEEKRAISSRALPWVMRLRAEKFQPQVQPGDVVLEYGAGAGWNLGKLRCARRIAFDTAGFLKEKVENLGAEFVHETSGIPAATADVLICHHVLEHLQNPVFALDEMRRILKPAGTLLLLVPWDREWKFRRFAPDEPNHHLFTWNAQTLGNLLASSGFDVDMIRVQRYGYDRFAANIAARLGLGYAGYRLIRSAMLCLRPLYEVCASAHKSEGKV